jgi:hypothetical protein
MYLSIFLTWQVAPWNRDLKILRVELCITTNDKRMKISLWFCELLIGDPLIKEYVSQNKVL